MRFLELIFSLYVLGAFEFLCVGLAQDLHLLDQPVDFLFQLEQVVLFGPLDLDFLELFLHLPDLHVSRDYLLLQKSVFLSQLCQLVLNCLNLSIFFLNLFLEGFDVFHDGKVVVLSHVDHVVDVFDFLIHVDGHCGDYFANIFSSLLVMLFHEVVFLQDSL